MHLLIILNGGGAIKKKEAYSLIFIKIAKREKRDSNPRLLA